MGGRRTPSSGPRPPVTPQSTCIIVVDLLEKLPSPEHAPKFNTHLGEGSQGIREGSSQPGRPPRHPRHPQRHQRWRGRGWGQGLRKALSSLPPFRWLWAGAGVWWRDVYPSGVTFCPHRQSKRPRFLVSRVLIGRLSGPQVWAPCVQMRRGICVPGAQ